MAIVYPRLSHGESDRYARLVNAAAALEREALLHMPQREAAEQVEALIRHAEQMALRLLQQRAVKPAAGSRGGRG